MELALICLASLLAGGIDSIVGGGGLILVPALFAVYPTTAPATLFGTNKSASVWGTSIATVQYARRVQMRWAVLLYTLAKNDLGRTHAPRHARGRETLLACAIGAVIGWYDGFFGPGTGSFFIFLFVRLLGYDFLNASASAKLLNVATNLSALALFAMKGHVWWQIGLVMAVANVIGSLIGTRLALKHGAGFVRGVFIVVVSALILKTGYDAFLK